MAYRMREPNTYAKRKPRRIQYCPSCGRRMMGLAIPIRDKNGNITQTHRCSSGKERGCP